MARSRDNGANQDHEWVFGYGSLIFKVDFAYLERSPASVQGWERRFWQGSHDHRGTPDSPGRVLTLIAQPGKRCAGMAYLVKRSTLLALDYREKNGYQRQRIDIHLAAGEKVRGLTYVAPPSNPAFLGPAPDKVIAQQMVDSSGPSGSNADYVIELAAALKALGEDDEHVFGLADLVRRQKENGD